MGYNDKKTYETHKNTRTKKGKAVDGRVTPKKNLGQHFLVDEGISKRIADTVDAYPDIPVLEVGPGTGMMTKYIIPKGRPFKVVEIDCESVDYLHDHYPDLEVINGDFLKMDLTKLFTPSAPSGEEGRGEGVAPFLLTGNYPYDISSQIFFKMLDHRDLIPCCTGMIQREVALRIASQPGNKAYGILSVMLQAWYDCEYLFTVDENVFNPPPKVKSAVICMKRNSRTELGCDETLFKRIVKTTFNQRRKMLRVSLKPLFGADNMPSAEFFQQDIMTKRPEQLSVEQFIELTNLVSEVI